MILHTFPIFENCEFSAQSIDDGRVDQRGNYRQRLRPLSVQIQVSLDLQDEEGGEE